MSAESNAKIFWSRFGFVSLVMDHVSRSNEMKHVHILIYEAM